MRMGNRASWVVLVVAGLVVSGPGCSPESKEKPVSPSTSAKAPPQASVEIEDDLPGVTSVAKAPDSEKAKPVSKPEEPPPPPTIPKVNLSDALRATCLVQVGDKLPDAELPDLEGKTQPLGSLYGEKLTVVCFWTGASIYSLEALSDLNADVAKPFADKGVRAVGISVRDTAETAKEKLKLADVSLPTLLDRDGAYFAKVATERLPRTYVLDGEGKILWFDIEYSRSTRRDMVQTIKVALGDVH